MGRRKIEIQPLIDERNRSVTFLKRKAGLFKKAHELSVLCQVDIAVIILGNNKKLYEFSSCDTDDLLKRYKTTNPHESKGPQDYGSKSRKPKNNNAAAQGKSASAQYYSNDDEDDEDDDDSVGTPPESPQNRTRDNDSNSKGKKRNSKSKQVPQDHRQLHQHQQHQQQGTLSAAQNHQSMQNQHIQMMNNYGGGTIYGPRIHQQPQSTDYNNYFGKSSAGYPQQGIAHHRGNSDTSKGPGGGQDVDMYVLRSSTRSASTDSSGQSPSILMQRYSGKSSSNSAGTSNSNSGLMRPKLKVQIPVGGDEQGSLNSTTREGSGGSSNEIDRDTDGSNQTSTSRSGSVGVTSVKERSDKSGTGDANNTTERSSQDTARGGAEGTGAGSSGQGGGGGPWANVLLPPPSPSSYLNSGTTGPGNPFGRPPLINSNGEQTPISAALPSKYVNDLLPSPSNFYGSEWNLHFSPATAAFGTGPNSAVPASSSGAGAGGPSVGIGISLGGVPNNQSTPTKSNNNATSILNSSNTGMSPVEGHHQQQQQQHYGGPELDVRKRTKAGSQKANSNSKRVKSSERSGPK